MAELHHVGELVREQRRSCHRVGVPPAGGEIEVLTDCEGIGGHEPGGLRRGGVAVDDDGAEILGPERGEGRDDIGRQGAPALSAAAARAIASRRGGPRARRRAGSRSSGRNSTTGAGRVAIPSSGEVTAPRSSAVAVRRRPGGAGRTASAALGSRRTDVRPATPASRLLPCAASRRPVAVATGSSARSPRSIVVSLRHEGNRSALAPSSDSFERIGMRRRGLVGSLDHPCLLGSLCLLRRSLALHGSKRHGDSPKRGSVSSVQRRFSGVLVSWSRAWSTSWSRVGSWGAPAAAWTPASQSR